MVISQLTAVTIDCDLGHHDFDAGSQQFRLSVDAESFGEASAVGFR